MTEQFDNLRAQLELLEWPNVYMFKFIAPNSPEMIARLTAMFDEGADLHFQPSRTGKYVSVSAKELMLDTASIMEKYYEAAKINGVIAL
ncbi:MAG: hypothetical protein A3D92_23495 [Bacteroidetes bacterium RIFCSPHIGHO2_02_FULL_44_7]|nr:MAG: hypothetical protein A3D92_23495 [Bacteroidetes bacterium RIFCSPHIGHO2_02_FULL_44_7]